MGVETVSNDEIVERKLLLKRVFSRSKLFKIGKALNIRYFRSFRSEWELDVDRATFEIGGNMKEEQLEEIFSNYKPRKWEVFKGQYYTFENGKLRLEGSWREIRTTIIQTKKKYGKNCVAILKCLVDSGNGCSLEKIRQSLPKNVDPTPILVDLEKHKAIVTSYRSELLQEWTIPAEVAPIIRMELGLASTTIDEKRVTSHKRAPTTAPTKTDPLIHERLTIQKMDRELDEYLNRLLKHRIDEAITFGKTFSISHLANYLRELFGPVLYFDSLLSIVQQYGLANVEIIHAEGRTGMRTGWNLSLFGEPGTGKSFSTRDLIMGKPRAKIPPYGVPGRNRYAGGITPARFIRIGQAYSGRVFNFIVPEFNDWFKYKGMVEPLKLAMEHGKIEYETVRETIGPYRFSSFFSVNYNVATLDSGYEVTVQDPNFKAIEDRMLCRLHRLTKQRFTEIAESQMRLAFGEIDVEEGAQQMRDHLAVICAAETKHPLVQKRFPVKPVLLTPKTQKKLTKARRAILEEIPGETVGFSARLENHAIRFACAASLLNYFKSNVAYVPVNDEALNYAIRLYVEEASVRSRQEFSAESVLKKLSID